MSVPPASLAALTALALLNALWSVVLWTELRVVRAGAAPFCALEGGGDCARVWDAPFAVAVHRTTGVPVAGWGLAWSLVAAALALAALTRAARQQPSPMLVTALRLMAIAGAVAVVVLMVVSALEQAFCTGCAVTYVLVAGFAGMALTGWPGAGWAELPRGAGITAAAVIGAWLLLLYPGTRTPHAVADAGRAALASASEAGGTTGPLHELVSSLGPQMQQALSDSLGIHRAAETRPEPEPRSHLLGTPGAPVRITEFTDVRCGHCADLHLTLKQLAEHVPPDAWVVVPRQFPLDPACNANMPPASRSDPVRCLAARAQICAEGQPGALAFSGALFERQTTLTADDVRTLARQHLPGVDLDACVTSADTERKLQADIALAMEHGIDGTPLVLVNGRRGTAFGPFLYAMVMTGGRPEHPAFASLPRPDPRAHIH